jgi:hypothetical protein
MNQVRRVRRVLLVLLVLVTGGCGLSAPPVALSPSYPSKDEAVEVFLQALTARDRAALQAVVLTETEFRKYVWPALPASDPAVGMPVDYIAAEFRQKNEAFAAGLINDHGGKEYRLLAATFGGASTDYGSFRVHRETRLDLRGPTGVTTLRLFGSMIESGGRWKIYSFVVD